MLFKNDQTYKLDDKEIKAVTAYFHNKFPVKVIYPSDRVVPSKLPHNRLPDKPNSIAFNLKSVVKEEGGTVVWRYADDVITDAKGNKIYVPRKFRFDGKRYLDRNEIELIYFLLRKSEYRLIPDEELKAKKIKQSRSPKFMFEDLVTEAEKRAEKKELEARITQLLYNKELCLPEEKIRDVARAYFIKNVDELSLPQVKIALEQKAYDKKLGGPDRFFEMVNADEEITSRSSIQKAIDMKQIVYDGKKSAWFWDTEGEGGKSIICRVSKTMIPVEALFDLYKGDEAFREDIKAILTLKKKKEKKDEENKDEE